ncbi:hypothetical protein C922_04904 [Plasmodium inui San Antonio 1]|uniref:Uncharacterized protein n=1 Tax=Plasmodium inui San Antonio 1 TaxID=1237626 RepID=W6ZZP2_9APIC|nr:hypothetical protein C922_04904 [Plasmodium inui San Antonio 1]EUD64760.1 hypothetical protein C922_04904 [Plasmodium inui San Antonio 1]
MKRAERKRKRKEKKKRRKERKERKRQKKEEKERLKGREAAGLSDELPIDSNHSGAAAVEGQAGPPPAEESYTNGTSPSNASKEGASSAVARRPTQMGGHPPEGSGGPIDPYGSYTSSPHDDDTEESDLPKQVGAGTGEGAALAGAQLDNDVKVIHLNRLKREPKWKLINIIKEILSRLH